MARNSCFAPDCQGLRLFIRLTPNASKEEVQGLEESSDGPVLKMKVRAIPDKGKANKAVCALCASWLSVGKRGVELKTGGKSRLKTLLISGDPDELHALVAAALERLNQ